MRKFLLACCVALALAWVAPSPVAAHAILMDSKPPALAILPPGSTHFVLRFNSRIDRARSRLELRRTESTSSDSGMQAATVPAIVAQPAPPDTLAADLPLSPGAWVLRWQVLAVDGHITRGEVPFTVRTP